MAKNAAPQVPGETTTTTDPDQPESNAAASEETVTIPKSKLDEILARLGQLETTGARPAAKMANPEAKLPEQDEIDPKTLKSPVLTKQGWIVPEGYGETKDKK